MKILAKTCENPLVHANTKVAVRPSLKINSLWTLLGNVVNAGSQSAYLIVIAKLGSPDLVGKFAFALALVTPVFMFTNLHLRSIQATDAKGDFRFVDYLGLRIIMTSLALFIIFIIVLCSKYQMDLVLLLGCIGVAKAIESISDTVYGLFQRHENMKIIASSMMIKGPLSLIVLSVLLITSGNIVLASLGIAVSWLSVCVLYDLNYGFKLIRSNNKLTNGDNGKPYNTWNGVELYKLFLVSFPMGVVMFLDSLYINIPRYFIEHLLGTIELGYFAALASLSMAGTTVVSAVGRTISPRLATYYSTHMFHEFKSLLRRIILLSVIIGIFGILIAMLIGDTLLSIIFTPEYATYLPVFVLLMIAVMFLCITNFLGCAVTAMRLFKVQVPIHILNLLVTTMISVWTIKQFGLIGATFAILAGAVVMSLCYLIILVVTWNKITANSERL